MAAPGFGFSVGDFIAGVSLVKKLVRALNDAAGSRAAYRKLINELLNLEEALTQIGNLQLSPAQESQKLILLRVATQCETSIEAFLQKNAKFKGSLGLQSSTMLPSWRTNLHKIQWALCKDNAIDDLRTEIAAHTTALNVTLATVQVSAIKLQEQSLDNCEQMLQVICDETKEANARGEQNGQTLVAHAAWMETISHDIAALVSGQQDNELLSFNQKSLQMNIKILDAVAQMQQLLRSLPPQIEREQPVIFEDAHGRITPVHVEFVNSFEAFQAVLLTRFQHMPGLRKVRNLEYSMQDARSQEILDLSKPWKSNFRPGRRLNMSMVFRMLSEVISTCPSCSAENPNLLGHGDADFQCDNPECRVLYRRIKEDDPRLSPRKLPDFSCSPENVKQYRKEDDNIDEVKSEEIHEFRRVQIVFKDFNGSWNVFLRKCILNTLQAHKQKKMELQEAMNRDCEELRRCLEVMTGLSQGTGGVQEPIYSFPSWSSPMQPAISFRTSTVYPTAPDWNFPYQERLITPVNGGYNPMFPYASH